MKSIFGFIFAIGALLWGGTISGKITDPSGKAYWFGIAELKSFSKTFLGQTDTSGKFIINDVEPGRYSLSVRSEIYLTNIYPESLIVSADTVISNLNIRLERGNYISGRVYSYNGEPLPNEFRVTVYKRIAGGKWGFCAGTDITTNPRTFDTTYYINKMTEGEYKVAINMYEPTTYFNQFYPAKHSEIEAEVIKLSNNESIDSINFTMQKGGTISGTISSPIGINEYEIEVFKKDNTPFRFHENGKRNIMRQERFCVGGLENGEYSIVVRPRNEQNNYKAELKQLAPQYYNNKYSSDSITYFTVNKEDTVKNIDVSLQVGGSISGKIKSEDGSKLPTTIWIHSILNQTDTTIPKLITTWTSLTISNHVDTTSRLFTFSGLPPGKLILSASCNPDSYSTLQLKSFYPNVILQDSSEEINVSLGKTTVLKDFVIPIGGKISGKITCPVNKTLPKEINISLYKGDRFYKRITISSSGLDTSVAYAFAGLPPGIFYIRAGSNDVYYSYEFYKLPSATSPTPIKITAREDIRNLNIKLQPGATISGTIKDVESNNPISGVLIRATQVDLDSITESIIRENFSPLLAVTDSSGKYSFTALPTGKYGVFFQNNTYMHVNWSIRQKFHKIYKNEYYKNALHFSQSEKVMLSQGATLTGIDLSLRKNNYGSVAGALLYGNGDTCKDFYTGFIECLNDNFIEGSAEDIEITYSTGRYIIKGLNPGKYQVRYNCVNKVSYHTGEVTVVAGDTTENINIYLTEPQTKAELKTQEIEVSTSLQGNYPNPFNPTTTIRYSLSTKDLAASKTNCLSIFDISGKVVRSFPVTASRAGSYSVQWDGKNSKNQPCGTGVYIYKLVLNNKALSKKMFMVR
ncbi:MAG: T9SS type A sorting domain-containing protein [Fibrobacteres bacterium]|nr:T9SS type A sorting domain-containing protein [Fibrobacterota bacterium]